jgi:Uma2 family endonuclease
VSHVGAGYGGSARRCDDDRTTARTVTDSGLVHTAPEGFTAEDLDRLPLLPPHTQLLDGGLVLRSPQSDVHMLTISLLVDGLRRTAPAEVRVRREMSVILRPRQRPEPDIVVIRSDADPGPKRTAYRPADVLLAEEVVSPDSEERDRRRKPQLYAEARIHHDRLKTTVPFDVDIDLTEIDNL